MDYRQAGVDIDAGNETVRRIKSLARATWTPGVLSEIGAFGGLFRLNEAGLQDPVLVSSADGVGTKLKEAEIREWIVDPKGMTAKTKAERKPFMKAYPNLAKDEVDALVAYMMSLKK